MGPYMIQEQLIGGTYKIRSLETEIYVVATRRDLKRMYEMQLGEFSSSFGNQKEPGGEFKEEGPPPDIFRIRLCRV